MLETSIVNRENRVFMCRVQSYQNQNIFTYFDMTKSSPEICFECR